MDCGVQPLVFAGVVGVCTYFIDRMHQRILKRQAHIGVQRQTHFTELFFSVALQTYLQEVTRRMCGMRQAMTGTISVVCFDSYSIVTCRPVSWQRPK